MAAPPAEPASASSGTARARGLMLVSVGFFTCNALLIRLLGSLLSVDAWAMSTFRFVIGMVIVLLPFGPGGVVSLPALIRNPLLVARGVFGGVGVLVYYETVVLLGAGRATFINTTYVVWGALLAAVILRERMRPTVTAALAIATVGVAMLTGVTGGSWRVSPADLLALFGALCAAIVVVLIRKLHERESTRSIFAGQCAWGLLFTAVPTATSWDTPAAVAVALLVLCGCLAGMGQLTMTAAYRHVPVAEGALLQMLTPVGIGIGGVVFFTERYTAAEAIGALLILVSCVLTIRTRPRLAAGLPVPEAAPEAGAEGASQAAISDKNSS